MFLFRFLLFCFIPFLPKGTSTIHSARNASLFLPMFGNIHLRIVMEFLPQLWTLHHCKKVHQQSLRMVGLSPRVMESYYFKVSEKASNREEQIILLFELF